VSWVNNAGEVAPNINTNQWNIAFSFRFNYIKHTLRQGSSIAGIGMFTP
jgi:hypothetical protein